MDDAGPIHDHRTEIEALLVFAEVCGPVVIGCEGHAYFPARVRAVSREDARTWMLAHAARYPGIDCRFQMWLCGPALAML